VTFDNAGIGGGGGLFLFYPREQLGSGVVDTQSPPRRSLRPVVIRWSSRRARVASGRGRKNTSADRRRIIIFIIK